MARPFLTAEWVNLILAQYAIDPALLAPRLAPGLELDLFDGRAFVSLVAFEFRATRILGVAWPRHVRFPEVNLRFYVRHPATNRRGVMFIRELVPRRVVSSMARWIYNEPYRTVPMRASLAENRDGLTVAYSWRMGRCDHLVRAESAPRRAMPAPDSLEHFFKEHEWGFGRSRSGRLKTYRVEHPEWEVYPGASVFIDVDFSTVYGPEWAGLTGAKPDSTILAAGSAVKVFPALRNS